VTPQYCYKAQLLRVIDGDTVQLQLDLGFDTHVIKTCRLIGINAPEMNTVAGVAAKTFLATILPAALVVTTTKPDKYGRSLVKIYLPNDEKVSVNDQMLSTGHAVPYMQEK
jgi:micrococcal nuclease